MKTKLEKLLSELSCCDGGCMYGHPGGMHTNGGCHCDEIGEDSKTISRRKYRMAIRLIRSLSSLPEIQDSIVAENDIAAFVAYLKEEKNLVNKLNSRK